MAFRRIRDLRIDHDFTQKYVANLLHMTQTGYSKYETGRNDLSTEALIKLSNLYEVSIDYLLNETDLEEKPPKNFHRFDE